MKFKPLHDRVLIEVLENIEKTSGGIIIPDSQHKKNLKREKWLLLVVEQRLMMAN